MIVFDTEDDVKMVFYRYVPPLVADPSELEIYPDFDFYMTSKPSPKQVISTKEAIIGREGSEFYKKNEGLFIHVLKLGYWLGHNSCVQGILDDLAEPDKVDYVK